MLAVNIKLIRFTAIYSIQVVTIYSIQMVKSVMDKSLPGKTGAGVKFELGRRYDSCWPEGVFGGR